MRKRAFFHSNPSVRHEKIIVFSWKRTYRAAGLFPSKHKSRFQGDELWFCLQIDRLPIYDECVEKLRKTKSIFKINDQVGKLDACTGHEAALGIVDIITLKSDVLSRKYG